MSSSPVKMKLSSNMQAVEQRIKKLPEYGTASVKTHVKGQALELIKEFKKGISEESFGLAPLKPATVSAKSRRGYSQPSTPLLGKGLKDKYKSYVSSLRLRELKKGYKVAPSVGRHWSGKISLKQLFMIHEHGCTIKRGETLIRIPARPAFLLAYQKVMANRRKIDFSKKVRRAMTEYVNRGKDSWFKQYTKALDANKDITE